MQPMGDSTRRIRGKGLPSSCACLKDPRTRLLPPRSSRNLLTRAKSKKHLDICSRGTCLRPGTTLPTGVSRGAFSVAAESTEFTALALALSFQNYSNQKCASKAG